MVGKVAFMSSSPNASTNPRDAPRPRVTVMITDDEVEVVIVKTSEEEAEERDALVDVVDLRKATGRLNRLLISRICWGLGMKALFGSRSSSFDDPLLVEKVRDVVGLDHHLRSAPRCSASTRKVRSRRSTVTEQIFSTSRPGS